MLFTGRYFGLRERERERERERNRELWLDFVSHTVVGVLRNGGIYIVKPIEVACPYKWGIVITWQILERADVSLLK